MREIKYWLVANIVHSAEFPYWLFHATEWVIYGAIDNKINEGDILYLANGEIGIYAWGYVAEVFQSDSTEQSYIKISTLIFKFSDILCFQCSPLDNADSAFLWLFEWKTAS